MGFEPTVGLSPTSVFKTDAFVHSAIPPWYSCEAEGPSECEVLYHRQYPDSIGLLVLYERKLRKYFSLTSRFYFQLYL